jgi:hypothetical protein
VEALPNSTPLRSTFCDPNIEAFSKIKREIRDAYATGKITELHYNLLNEQMSDILGKK